MFIKDPNTRKWIYGIVAAAIPVLVILGFVSGEDTQVWLNLAAAVLGLGTAGLAVPNTPPAPTVPRQVTIYSSPDAGHDARATVRQLDDGEPKHRL